MKITPTLFAEMLRDAQREMIALFRRTARARPSKHRIIGSKRSQERAAAREQHVARVAEQSRRSHRHFLKTGHKPPRKMRLKWAKEIARDVAA